MQALLDAIQTDLRTAKADTDSVRRELEQAQKESAKARADTDSNLSWFVKSMNQWSEEKAQQDREIKRLQAELRRFLNRRG
jgi:chromosome segregation ATPase